MRFKEVYRNGMGEVVGWDYNDSEEEREWDEYERGEWEEWDDLEDDEWFDG